MLKNVLSLLLSKFYSKKENEAVGHQAMPSGISTTLLSNATVNDWGTVSSGVAATDGYLVLTARNAGNEGASLSLNVEGVARQSLTYPFVGAGGNAFVPIGKGDSWALIGSSSDSITLKLFKTVGGGYQDLRSALLLGGGLCLNSLSSSLRRTSLLVKRIRFRTGQTLKIIPPSQSQSLLTRDRFPMWHHQMALSKWRFAMALRQDTVFLSLLPERSCTLGHILQPLLVGQATISGLQKGIPLRSSARSTIQEVDITLSRLTNSAVGGVSC